MTCSNKEAEKSNIKILLGGFITAQKADSIDNVIYESFVTLSNVENSEWKDGDRPYLEATSIDRSHETGSS